MKQLLDLPLTLRLAAAPAMAFLVALITSSQVQGGIITNQQQSLTLPDALASAIVDNATATAVIALSSASSSANNKNGTKSGRVIYSGSYSNVRIASKEPNKSLLVDKYFPLPLMSKKSVLPAANIVPVLPPSSSTTTTTTSTTTTTTTPPPPPPPSSSSTTSTTSTTTSEAPSSFPIEEEAKIPDVLEFIEESEPMNDDDEDDDLVTETVKDESSSQPQPNNNDNDTENETEDEEATPTEPNIPVAIF